LGGRVNRRVDRLGFDIADLNNAIDAHMRRNGWESASWTQYTAIMERAMPDVWPDWCGLRDEWLEMTNHAES